MSRTTFQPVRCPARAHPAQRAARRAFTLLEVLMAVVIIALGMLGISALFAGSARQAQIASQTTKSVTFTKNAEARCIKRFQGLERLSGTPNPCGETLNTNDKLNAVWRPFVSVDSANGWNELSIYTQLSNENNGADRCGSMFFRETGAPFVMYDVSESTANYPDDFSTTPAGQSAIGLYQAANPNEFITKFGFRAVFPARRVLLDTPLTVEVAIRSTLPADPLHDAPQIIRYTWVPDNALLPCQPSTGARLTLAGSLDTQSSPADGSTTGGFFYLDTQKCPATGLNLPLAAFTSMRIKFLQDNPANRFIESIRVTEWEYRTSDVLALRDRILTEESPEGPRDTMAIGLLWRQVNPPSGPYQIAMFTYALQGDSAASRYLPPEDSVSAATLKRKACPIRQADLTLSYDNNPSSDTYRKYFVFTSATADAWALRPGQILLVAGDDSSGPVIPGADDFVRVVRSFQANGGLMAELDRGPRSSNKPIVPLNQLTGAGLVLPFYAINDTVIALSDKSPFVLTPGYDASGGTRWALRPVEARVFQAQGR